jgi:hypothetical protein
MGLDMHAYKTHTALKRLDFMRTRDAVQFHYWRKHYGLHAFMEQLYRSQGGTDSFNLVPLLLEPADLDALEAAVTEECLPFPEGFVLGQYPLQQKEDDLRFIRAAREAFREGCAVFYNASW